MSITEQLQALVDGVARSGALTPDAIRQFDEYRVKVTKLEAELEERTASRDSHSRESKRVATELASCKEVLNAANRRIAELEALQDEAKVAKLEVERRQEMRSILSDVFRNAEIMRSITYHTPMLVPGLGGSTGYVQNHETREQTMETRR